MKDARPVLVVGAGPVGLTAATELARRGVPVRIIDQASGPSPLTKALMVWPRTLEVLRRLGGGAHIEKYGLPVDSFRYYSDARQICRLAFDQETQPAVITQPDVEALLRAALEEAGGRIEWGTTLVELGQDADGVTAVLQAAGGTPGSAEFAYVIGADGASSTVRRLIGLEFEGSTYPNLFILADTSVEGELQRDAVHYFQSERGILVMVPLYNGRFRVFTAGPPDLRPEDLTDQVLQEYVDHRGPGGLRLHDVDWKTTFKIHARHTDRFQVGRVFVAGDAAHIHSPAGGQGLNTGVTDAHNLVWKMALVLRGSARADLFDSYGAERSAVAAAVVRQAEVQTKAWMLKEPWQVALRDAAAGLAERTGLFDRFYTPWLAGLTNGYPAGIAVGEPEPADSSRQSQLPPLLDLLPLDGLLPLAPGEFRNGFLLPDLPVEVSGARGVSPLREELTTSQYTLLVTLPAGANTARAATETALKELRETYGDLVTVRTVTERGVLVEGLPSGGALPVAGAGRPWRPRTFGVLLVRPDHYIAEQDGTPGLERIQAHLRGVLLPARALSDAPA
ncbi:FAD-dependent monooxygenase [Kitasatospora sp. NPDC049258]|uniref:FAD-dependent monooxygenase n=1 Tax=Kitasatospora sp. NPDC049258 TaxID=3155394 RepID=UPI0034420E10